MAMEGTPETQAEEYFCALCESRSGTSDKCCCPDDHDKLVLVPEEKLRRRINLKTNQKLCIDHSKKLRSGLIFGHSDWYECCTPFHVKSPRGSRLRPVPHTWKSYFESPSGNRYRPRQRICWDCYMITMEVINKDSDGAMTDYSGSLSPASSELGYTSPRQWASGLAIRPDSPSAWSVTSAPSRRSLPRSLSQDTDEDSKNANAGLLRKRYGFPNPLDVRSLDYETPIKRKENEIENEESVLHDSLQDKRLKLNSASKSLDETVSNLARPQLPIPSSSINNFNTAEDDSYTMDHDRVKTDKRKLNKTGKDGEGDSDSPNTRQDQEIRRSADKKAHEVNLQKNQSLSSLDSIDLHSATGEEFSNDKDLQHVQRSTGIPVFLAQEDAIDIDSVESNYEAKQGTRLGIPGIDKDPEENERIDPDTMNARTSPVLQSMCEYGGQSASPHEITEVCTGAPEDIITTPEENKKQVARKTAKESGKNPADFSSDEDDVTDELLQPITNQDELSQNTDGELSSDEEADEHISMMETSDQKQALNSRSILTNREKVIASPVIETSHEQDICESIVRKQSHYDSFNGQALDANSLPTMSEGDSGDDMPKMKPEISEFPHQEENVPFDDQQSFDIDGEWNTELKIPTFVHIEDALSDSSDESSDVEQKVPPVEESKITSTVNERMKIATELIEQVLTEVADSLSTQSSNKKQNSSDNNSSHVEGPAIMETITAEISSPVTQTYTDIRPTVSEKEIEPELKEDGVSTEPGDQSGQDDSHHSDEGTPSREVKMDSVAESQQVEEDHEPISRQTDRTMSPDPNGQSVSCDKNLSDVQQNGETSAKRMLEQQQEYESTPLDVNMNHSGGLARKPRNTKVVQTPAVGFMRENFSESGESSGDDIKQDISDIGAKDKDLLRKPDTHKQIRDTDAIQETINESNGTNGEDKITREEIVPELPDVPKPQNRNRDSESDRAQLLRRRMKSRSQSLIPPDTNKEQVNLPKVSPHETDIPVIYANRNSRRGSWKDKRRKFGVSFVSELPPEVIVEESMSTAEKGQLIEETVERASQERKRSVHFDVKDDDGDEIAEPIASIRESRHILNMEKLSTEYPVDESNGDIEPQSTSEDEDVSAVLSDVFTNAFTMKSFTELIQSFNTGSTPLIALAILSLAFAIMCASLAVFIFVL